MIIQFDENVTQPQAQGIILLLQSLYPTLNNSQPVNSLALRPSDTTPAEQTNPVQATTSGPTLVPSDSEAPRRTRRTKAQIEADEAAAKAQATTLAGPGPVSAPTLQTAIESTAEPVPTPSKPVTGDDLRTLLNAFIAKHSMEDALALLQEFKCNRVSEALSLEPATLAKLVEKLNA